MTAGDVAPFHRFARVYDAFMSLYPASESALRAGLAAAERPVERVLDVGGGTGRAARTLPDREVVVLDAARGMLERARSHGLETTQGDAARLPVRDHSVDAVLVVDALHHMGDPDAAIAEARRVVRPGGVVLVREFDPTTLLGRGLVAGEHLVGFDSVFFTPESLRDRLEAVGLSASIPDRGFTYTAVGVAGERTSEGTGDHRDG
jgi:demethylmenaquinone methyltransferase/2-methoxy-6-polyprenyl-1,4-benzoquinol methylase